MIAKMKIKLHGLHGKLLEFESLLKDEKPDIVAITEIKMNETSVNLYEIHCYFPYTKIRDENGDGVALLVKEHLASESIQISSRMSLEELVGT